MKLGAALFLGLGLCGTSLTAQQSLLASAPLPPIPLSEFVLPAPPVSGPSIKLPETAPELAATVGVGLPNISLYNSIEPQTPATVCAQLRAASWVPAEMSSYAFSKAQFSLASLKASFEHDNLVKMAHNFVPGQPLPDAPSYVPLTAQQKFDLFARSTHSADMGFSIMADALIAQASGAWPTLGGGMGGFGQRLGVSAAGEEAASFFSGFVFPTLFHQDPRYFRSHQTRIIDRLAYAASRVIIGRSDDGRAVINLLGYLRTVRAGGTLECLRPLSKRVGERHHRERADRPERRRPGADPQRVLARHQAVPHLAHAGHEEERINGLAPRLRSGRLRFDSAISGQPL